MEIKSIALPRAPKAIAKLASIGDTLVAWNADTLLHDAQGNTYHFAIYRHGLGWRGYALQGVYEPLRSLHPTSEETLWFEDDLGLLFRLAIPRQGKVHITHTIDYEESRKPLIVTDKECWALCTTNEPQLKHYVVEGETIFTEEQTLDFVPRWGLVGEGDEGKTSILGTSDGFWTLPQSIPGKLTQQTWPEALSGGDILPMPPFVVCKKGDRIYYTLKPNARQTWQTIPLPEEVTRQIIGIDWLACAGDICYIALSHGADTTIYRFQHNSPERLEVVLPIKGYIYGYALHRGLLCLSTDLNSIIMAKQESPLENSGFLVFDPSHGNVYTDFPQRSQSSVSSFHIPTRSTLQEQGLSL